MIGTKHYSLAIPPDADAMEVQDTKVVISLTCEDPSNTEVVPPRSLRIGQCWSFPWLDDQL